MRKKGIKRILLAGCFGNCLIASLLMAPAASAQTTTTTSTATSWAQESSSKASEEGCDDKVLQLISQAQENQIQGETKMAHSIYDYLNDLKNQAKSCLDNMMPSAIFQKTDMSGLWNQLGSMVCSKLNEMADPTLNTINAGINKGTDALTGALFQNVTLGNGTLNLGSVSTGVQINRGGSLFSSGAFNTLYEKKLTNENSTASYTDMLNNNAFTFNQNTY